MQMFGWGLRLGGTGGGGSSPPPVYLPTVSSSPVFAAGVRKLVSAYSGNLFQANNGSTTLDISGDGVANYAALDAFTATPTISAVYDQVGTNHLTSPSTAEQPIMDTDQVLGPHRAINFSGWINQHKSLQTPTGLGLDNRAHSVFLVLQCKTGRGGDYTWEGASSVPAALINIFTRSNATARSQRCQYQVLGHTSGVNGATQGYHYLIDDQILIQGNKVAGTIDRFLLGKSSTAPVSLSHQNLLAKVVYPTVLSDADAAIVVARLEQMFGVNGYSNMTKQVVMVGDSIMYGLPNNQDIGNKDTAFTLAKSLPSNVALYNMGNPSQTLTGSTGNSLAFNSATYENTCLNPTQFPTKRILCIQIGTNDIGANGATPGYGATLYAAMASYITAQRAAGFTHIVLATLLKRSDALFNSESNQRNIELVAYNDLVRANSAGADAIVDLEPLYTFAQTQNLTIFQDGLHPMGPTYEAIAPSWLAGINAVL